MSIRALGALGLLALSAQEAGRPADRSATLLRNAAYYESRGKDPQAALSIYEEVRRRHPGTRAALVALDHVVLLQERLGQRDLALVTRRQAEQLRTQLDSPSKRVDEDAVDVADSGDASADTAFNLWRRSAEMIGAGLPRDRRRALLRDALGEHSQGGQRATSTPVALALLPPELFATLEQIDANGDGRVDRAEFEPFSSEGSNSWLGFDRFEDLVAATDRDGDRLVSAPEAGRWVREQAPAEPACGYFDPGQRGPAPDFVAISADDGAPVALSSYFGRKPVALLFGSRTCGRFSRSAESLKAIFATHGTAVQFLVIYIREAHAIGSGWVNATAFESGLRDPVDVNERKSSCASCIKELDLAPIPALVDDMDDKASRAYAAWPSRMLLIDVEGRVAYRSAPGPQGFKPLDLLDAIRRERARR